MNFLRQTGLVFRRELGALLAMPLFYVLCGIFFLLSGAIYLVMLLEFVRGVEGMTVNVTDSVVRATFHSLHFFLMVQVPLLTMRVFSEERASGMLDLLQTTPVRDWALINGKFLATVSGLVLYIGLTMVFPLATSLYGEVEWPIVAASAVALALSAACYVAVGLFFSAITESQVVAAVLTYVTLFAFAFGQYFADGWQVLPLQQALKHFTITEHVAAILSGNMAVMNFVYFVVMTWIFLFLAARTLESRRWKA